MTGITKRTVKGAKGKTHTYWYATINGQKKYMGSGPKGKERAEAARGKHLGKKYENQNVQAGLDVKRSEFESIPEMLEWYLDLPDIKKQKSFNRKQIAANNLIEYFTDQNIKLVHTTPDTIDKYIEQRREQKVLDSTINVELSLLNNAYKLAVQKWQVHRDFVPGSFVISQKDIEEVPRRLVTDEEYTKLVDAATDDFRDMIVLAYETAMRSGEICNLRFYRVHLDEVVSEVPYKTANYISLGKFGTKNKTDRIVPLSETAQKLLRKRLEGLHPDDYVFLTDNAQPFTSAMVSERFRSTCNRAGIIYGDEIVERADGEKERLGIVFHCLRHTRTTLWVRMGLSDEIIRRATGHLSLAAYQKYVKLDAGDIMVLVNGRTDLGQKPPKPTSIAEI